MARPPPPREGVFRRPGVAGRRQGSAVGGGGGVGPAALAIVCTAAGERPATWTRRPRDGEAARGPTGPATATGGPAARRRQGRRPVLSGGAQPDGLPACRVAAPAPGRAARAARIRDPP